MLKKLINYIIILSISMLFTNITIQAHEHEMNVSRDKALEIANSEAKKIGYDITIMNIITTKYNTPWNKYLPKDSNDEYHAGKMSKLKNREYWAIYYYPDRKKVGLGYKGGDFCIFIDTNSGEIITDIRWK